MAPTVAVLGLGYVGCVSAAGLAKLGHQVIGVDINRSKVDLINRGRPTIVEQDIEQLVAEQHRHGHLTATTDSMEALAMANLSIVCVGTPSANGGSPNLSAVWSVAGEIGDALRGRGDFHTIAIRSTVPPGTCRKVDEIIASRSGKEPERDFAVVSNPEFLREGTSVHDYFHPPYTVIGTQNDRAFDILSRVYSAIDAPIIKTARELAELIKYVSNAYHALKIAFANEIGAICKDVGLDSHQAMDLLCRDSHLNSSSAYLKPGFAFGGSCLPKDLRALQSLARRRDLKLPVLWAIEMSNALQVERALNMIVETGRKRLGVLGLAFKPGTDDLRESPAVELLERLLGKGYELRVHDRYVSTSALMGANKKYIETKFPHLAALMVRDLPDLMDWAEAIVVAHRTAEYQAAVEKALPSKMVIDLARVLDDPPISPNYRGIAW